MTRLLRFPEAVRHDPAVDLWLDQRLAELGVLARRWFAHMRTRGRDVRELMHDGQATACVGDAAFASVGVYTAHVNVGFFLGAQLRDPAHLLQGTGRFGRHVKLRPGVDVDAAALAALIDASYADVRARVDAD